MSMLKLDILTILLVVLALLLTGCSTTSNTGPSNGDGAFYGWPGWTGNYQERNERFTVNYDPGKLPGPWLYIIDQVWLDVQACVGLAPPDPKLVIEYVAQSNMPLIDGSLQVTAYINYDTRYIRITDYDLQQNQSNHLRHEFVHYLLWWAQVPQSDLNTHNSQFYAECQV